MILLLETSVLFPLFLLQCKVGSKAEFYPTSSGAQQKVVEENYGFNFD